MLDGRKIIEIFSQREIKVIFRDAKPCIEGFHLILHFTFQISNLFRAIKVVLEKIAIRYQLYDYSYILKPIITWVTTFTK